MLEIDTKYRDFINYVIAAQNVPIIDSLIVYNTSERSLCNLDVEIRFSQSVATNINIRGISIPSQSNWILKNICPQYNLEYLYNLQDISESTIVITLSLNGTILKSNVYNLFIIDYKHYWGNRLYNKYLASYVTPNYGINAVIDRVSELLYQRIGISSFEDHYSKNIHLPLMIIQAIYESIIDQQISFAYPTMSLRDYGQRIRLATEILAGEKKASCLDIALFFCSCLERMRLKPLLIMQENHAFVGCWLINQDFGRSVLLSSNPIIKDTLSKHPQIVLVESTFSIFGLKRGKNEIKPFETAVQKANKLILDTASFDFALDISYSRKEGIIPINKLPGKGV